ncbi:MAG: UDP-3-O-(3-hydroxymyristoyl)glucosamine N-acyltransferase [Candidatus Eisenbacteria bacterium]|nr:UDP-3-O-(3-hydroxymyristoyl)glucosamine N-acyltransferase [Candidatus Eisenbacteria bacterium]
MQIRLKEIAKRLDGRLLGDGEVLIKGVAAIKDAEEGDLTFLSNPKYEAYLSTTKASAIIVKENELKTGKPLIVTDDPYLAFLKTLRMFRPEKAMVAKGIHPSAVIGEGVSLGHDISIGANVVVADGAVVGDEAAIMAGVYIGERASIGKGTLVYPNVTIREECSIGERVIIHSGTVIGSDGFGFVREGKTHQKIPQTGTVIVEDDVEIGANVTVDRATIGATTIKKGTKIDNLVQIAHNVTIGENSIIVAQVGISGSTEIGQNVTLGGQAGIAGHIQIGDNTLVGAQAGVIGSIPPNSTVSGYPALPHNVSMKIHAAMGRLPEVLKRIKVIEKKLQEIEAEKKK